MAYLESLDRLRLLALGTQVDSSCSNRALLRAKVVHSSSQTWQLQRYEELFTSVIHRMNVHRIVIEVRGSARVLADLDDTTVLGWGER